MVERVVAGKREIAGTFLSREPRQPVGRPGSIPQQPRAGRRGREGEMGSTARLVGASSSPGTRTYADEASEYSRQVTLVGETTCQSHLR